MNSPLFYRIDRKSCMRQNSFEWIDKYILKPMANIHFLWNTIDLIIISSLYVYFELRTFWSKPKYIQYFQFINFETTWTPNLELFGEGFLSFGALCSQSLLAVSFPSSRITARNSTGQSSSSKDLTLKIQILLFSILFFMFLFPIFKKNYIKKLFYLIFFMKMFQFSKK